MIEFLTTTGLFAIIIGGLLGFAGIWMFWKRRKNGALFLGTIIVLIGLGILVITSMMIAEV